MRRRCFITTIMFAISLLLLLSVCAGGAELRYQTIDPRSSQVYMNGQFTQALLKPEEIISKEPEYRSKSPIYVSFTFGNDADNKYALVLDESQGTGRGYDTLYVDRNNNESLADDPKIMMRSGGGRNTYQTEFGPVEVMVKYENQTVPYSFFLWCYKYSNRIESSDGRNINNVRIRIQPGGYYAGKISIGGSSYNIAVVDYNGNGLFNEYTKIVIFPTGGSASDRLYAMGDQVIIDANSNGNFDPNEYQPFGKYTQFGSKWYTLDISDQGDKVEAIESDVELGTVKVPNGIKCNVLELVSTTGDGVVRLSGDKQEFSIPAGKYRLYSYAIQATKPSSGTWTYTASGTGAGKEFEVREDSTFNLKFGAPLVLNISSSPDSKRAIIKAGTTINLSLNFFGQDGEVLTGISMGRGNTPPAPTFKVVDESGRTVANGKFEYG